MKQSQLVRTVFKKTLGIILKAQHTKQKCIQGNLLRLGETVESLGVEASARCRPPPPAGLVEAPGAGCVVRKERGSLSLSQTRATASVWGKCLSSASTAG